MIRVNAQDAASVSVTDRAFQYGDGLFETLYWRDGKVAYWPRHHARLMAGCERLKIRCPEERILIAEVGRVASHLNQAVVKIIVSRGSSARGYRAQPDAEPTLVVMSSNVPKFPTEFTSQGIHLGLCTTRLGFNPILAGLKHLNRLEQVIARQEWDDPKIPEALMQDLNGNVIEGTMSNLFLVQNGVLKTPKLDQCGISGVMRAVVMDLSSELEIQCQETSLSLEDVETADALFVTNSLIGIWPVRSFQGRELKSDGMTRRLMNALEH